MAEKKKLLRLESKNVERMKYLTIVQIFCAERFWIQVLRVFFCPP